MNFHTLKTASDRRRYLRYTLPMAKVLVSFDEKLLKRIDRAAKAGGESRSAFLARLAEDRSEERRVGKEC